MSEQDPSVETKLLAALKREMQRPADEAVAKDVATRLGATLGMGLSVAAPAIASTIAPSALETTVSAGSAAAKWVTASHPFLAPLSVLVGSAAVTGLSLFGVLSLSGPPAALHQEVPRAAASPASSQMRARPPKTGERSAAPVSSAKAPGPPRTGTAVSAATALTASPSSSPKPEASLRAQQELLDTARRALSRGESVAALAALAAHAARFPRSLLEEEREALTVKALRAAQRTQEANERAARFASAYPSSVFLPSVTAPVESVTER